MLELEESSKIIEKIKYNKPLIHHITNYVSVNDCANIVLALGGSPIMADDPKEVVEVVSKASALVINIGTLNDKRVQSMLLAGRKANELGIPVILDPVGVGASTFRKDTVNQLLKNIDFTVIRGNASEMQVLMNMNYSVAGVDSMDFGGNTPKMIRTLAQKYKTTVAITGATDSICDGTTLISVSNGHSLLSQVTGTGCMTTSLIATCLAVTDQALLAALAGVLIMDLAGEGAYASLKAHESIGTFKVRIFDHIHQLTEQTILEGGSLDVSYR
ncbi:Hydroxyethylthiazole kinase [Alkaliphilus metalliredigens QYMF]|uniref:Hydroxyethylthiazole kinase n=1 Tax=Alkaliphilus metalliredigens (strain QYMF) TaxID=293826 RepID=THIM_ALKMQ|nr:hydroxyethylthiazole kinase [Alkaliphilus metalliredigens]A6TMN6.1 RecName: Full=Hydroxyethylthiazole kinase; AltName: Full=4-methyl-5-beta-hydroxyethylthiazole kinase; Short=TH kinase; Short=Thz kinase [Alkaliphilus metalliredigens QYMF]ABR47454.1 Hydroxyethylthiazole kinase [Alkaliphilus metalliredigens QYMF]